MNKNLGVESGNVVNKNFKISTINLDKLGSLEDINSYLKHYQLRFNKQGKLENTIPGVNHNIFSNAVLEQKFYLSRDKNLLKNILVDALCSNEGLA